MQNRVSSRVKATLTDSHFLIPLGVFFVGLALLSRGCIALTGTNAADANRNSTVSIPFVGCASDGQVGPVKPPQGGLKRIPVPATAAPRLAYYSAKGGPGVLGPRGWSCFEAYGSNGNFLYLSPEPINGNVVISDHWKGFTGPAIQISEVYGGTSGRFEVAKVIARVFPAHLGFVRNVAAEGFAQTSDFPTGPYPADKLTYKNADTVEYETPPNQTGLGTDSRLVKSGEAIYGVAILSGEDTDLTLVAVRPGPEYVGLVPVVVREVEREAPSFAN